jgi:tetratricopeptide (TPR) repeat protein
MDTALNIIVPAKDQLDRLFAKAYHDAVISGANMLQATELFEPLRQSIASNPRLQAWSDISLESERYDQQPFISLLINLRDGYHEMIVSNIVAEVNANLLKDAEKAWRIWQINYVEALMYGSPEVFDALCRADIQFPEKFSILKARYSNLNKYMLQSRWVNCYDPLLELANIDWLTREQRARLYIFAGQIYMYWFPDFQLAKKHFDTAFEICDGCAVAERGYAEYYLKAANYPEASDHLLKAQLKEPGQLDNLLISGDISKDQAMHEAAEAKYNDAIRKNFIEASAYSRLVALYGDPALFSAKKVAIEPLLLKAKSLETNYPVKHILYNLTRDAAYAFSLSQDYTTSEKYYNDAIGMQPANTAAIIDLAYIFAYQEKHKEAEDHFKKALQVDPRTFEAYWGLGWLYSQKTKGNEEENLKKAEACYLECLAISPSWDGLISYTIGLMYEKHEHFESAKTYLEKAVADNPRSGEYFSKLGGIYEKLENFPLALSAHEKAAALAPSDPLTLNKIGNLHYDLGDYTKAKAYYQQAVDNGGNAMVYFKNLGLASRKLEQWDESIAAYSRALEMKADDPEALNAIGVAHFGNRNYAEARTYYHQALKFSNEPENANDAAVYWANIGLTWRDEGNLAEAKEAYKHSLELNPESADNQNYTGVVYYRDGDYATAIKHYTRAIELAPTYTFYENVGLVYTDKEEYEEAITYFKKAIEADETSHSSINYLGNVYFRMKEYEKACKYYEEAVRLQPQNEYYTTNAGLTYYYRSDFIKGRELFYKALSYAPVYVTALNHCANCNLFLGAIKEAQEQFRKCISIEPSESFFHSNLGFCFAKQNRLDEAQDSLNKAINLNENNFEAVSYLGLIAFKRGDMDMARQYYFKAYPNQEQDPIVYYQLLDPEGSKEQLEETLANNPDDFITLWQMGFLNYVNKDLEGSKKHFGKAFNLVMDNEVMLSNAIGNLKKIDKEQWFAATAILEEVFKGDDVLSKKLGDLKKMVEV